MCLFEVGRLRTDTLDDTLPLPSAAPLRYTVTTVPETPRTMNVVAKEPWDWMLQAEGERWILTVVVGSSALVNFSVELTPAERAAWTERGVEGIRGLIVGIQQGADRYKGRRVESP